MRPIPYYDIEDAFDYANFNTEYGSNSAVIDLRTGKIHYSSDYELTGEEPDPIFEDEDAEGKLCYLPDKRDIGLGRDLVYDFAEEKCPDEVWRINDFFSHAGAYRRFKDFLEYRNLLQEWYDFEQKRTKEALLAWCEENEISVLDVPRVNPEDDATGE